MTAWQLLEPPDEAARAWRAIDEASPHATYFHTPDWAEAFCSAMPEWEPDPVAVEFADGNLAVLPMLQHTDSGHRQSMAPYVYGGPVFLRPPDVAHMEEVGAVARWYSDIVLYDNPFSPYPWHQSGLVRWRIHTHVLELVAGFDSVFAGARTMIRRHCRAAERAGVSVTVARSADQVDEYYEAYQDSLDRWGDTATARYPRELLHALLDLEDEGGRGVRLWLGNLDGRVVSGVLVLYRGAHCVVWHAATHSEYLRSNASALVYLTAIRAACEEGLRWFDFNPSGHLRGVEFFKESWGAKRLQFDMYHSPSFTRSELLEPAETVLET